MENIPKHVAIILDGNGRWAKARNLPRNMGHVEGAKRVEEMCEIAYNRGVQYLTVYAFSTENWSRPAEEVEALMKLLRNYLVNCIKRSMKNNMCVRIIGDKSRLDEDIQKAIADLEEATKDNTGLHFTIAINYGGRDEIVRAIKKISAKVADGSLKEEDINEKLVSDTIDTAGLPDPDLLIRTCNEYRISNFLPWQIAYSEFYFTEVTWPDFGAEELERAIESYQSRTRKFGGLK